MIENAYYNWPFFLFFSRWKDKAHWNKEGVDLNLNDFLFIEGKCKYMYYKAANSNGRPILTAEFWDYFLIKAQLKMPNLDHDAAGSAANAAYFGAFLVKGN
jgi:hypothetical protein